MTNLSGITTSDYEVYITASSTNGYINIQRTDNTGDYYGASSSGNSKNTGRLYSTGNSNETNLLPEWANESNNQFKLSANVTGQYKHLKYNTGSPRFAFYNSAGEKIVFYKKTNSGNTVAAPTFSPAAGTYFSTQNVAITCATSGATIYYTTDGNDPTTSSSVYSSPIAISQNTTVKAIGVKEGYTNSSVATATYTFPTLITIAEAKALADNEYALVQGVVTFIDGKNVFIQDETAGIVLFLNANASGVALGDEVKAYGKKTTYNGLIELTGINQNSSVFNIISSGNELPLATKTIAEILDGAANTLQCTRVKIEDAVIGTINTNGNTPLTQDNSSINIYKVPSLSEIQSGDHVNVIGVIGYFNAAQLRVANADDVEKIVNTDPSINIANATISVSAEGASGTLAVTYTNITEINAAVFFCNAEGVSATYDWITANINTENNVEYTISANNDEARTSYLKVKVGDTYSNLVTINQAKYVAPTVATLPFTYDGNGQGDLPDGFTVNGLSTYSSSPKMQFNSAGDWAILHFGERPGTLTFDIKGNGFSGGTFKVQTSEDGTNYTDLETYTELGAVTQSKVFNNLGENVRYIKWIYTEKSSGNVALGNINLAQYVAPQAYTLTVGNPEHITLTATYGEEVLTNGDDASVISNTEITLAVTVDDGYVLQSVTVDGEGSVTVTETSTSGFYTFVMPAFNVTVNATAIEAASIITYTRATSIVPGKHYIITNGSNKAMGAQNGNNRLAVDVIINNEVASVNSADVREFIINSEGESVYSIYDEIQPGYLYAASSSSNHLKTEPVLDDNGKWTISINANGVATVTAQGTNSRNIMRYNSGSTLFSCYGSGQDDIYLFQRDEETIQTFTKTISGYGESTNGSYYLIATPVLATAPSASNGFLVNEYDLYAFDQTKTEEWRNYKTQGFNLVSGKGYLYANSTGTTLTFTGTPYSGNGEVTLSKTDDADFAGWNLVGNPFGQAAYIGDRAFYKMNTEGTDVEVVNVGTAINVMEGIFVVATTDQEKLTFSTTAPGKGAAVAMNLSRDRGTAIDRAIVRFDEGDQLPKFQLNPNNTKIYVTEGNQDFAVVRSAAEGEMPVSFKAAENGTYTINVDVENMEMDYLHLIDNMTGTDVDLLATPSYTFNAKTSDYASRFKLVFSANEPDGPSTGSGSFAYFNGSEWQISNLGEATLQVIDVTGRIVKNETISGNASISINEAPGVYMMRLVSGNEVKVQKVVVR